jgi:hypothetical protein
MKRNLFQNIAISQAVFRIRDIVRRIRILGSVHWIRDRDLDLDLDPGSAPDPSLFVSGFHETNEVLFSKVFFLFITY